MTKGTKKKILPTWTGSNRLAIMLEDINGKSVNPSELNRYITNGTQPPKLHKNRRLPKGKVRTKRGFNARWRSDVKNLLRRSTKYRPAFLYDWDDISRAIDEESYVPGESYSVNLTRASSEPKTVTGSDQSELEVFVQNADDAMFDAYSLAKGFEAGLSEIEPIIQKLKAEVNENFETIAPTARFYLSHLCHKAMDKFVCKTLKSLSKATDG